MVIETIEFLVIFLTIEHTMVHHIFYEQDEFKHVQ